MLLTAVAFAYQLDRNLIYITQELIKVEFKLTDTQVGMISGMAYGLASGLAALPMGWLIDRSNRAKLLGAFVTIWSVMTAACGMAGSFATLFLARVGVGLAESGSTPASLSILSDTFPPERRASKMGVVSSGFSIGVIVSTLAGGYIAGHYGWRAAFLVCGLPGVALGLLLFFTLKEPPRPRDPTEKPIPAKAVPGAIARLMTAPGLRVIFVATAMSSMVSIGAFSWWPSFLIRVHKLDLPTVGVITTLGLGVSSMLGTLCTGLVTDWARRRTPAGPFLVVAVTTLISLTFFSVSIWTPSTAVMVVALCLGSTTAGAYVVPRNAALSELAPAHLRAVAFTLPILIANLVGVAFGPVAVGAISDFASARFPDVEPLRVAIFSVLLLNLPIAALYLVAANGQRRRAAALSDPR